MSPFQKVWKICIMSHEGTPATSPCYSFSRQLDLNKLVEKLVELRHYEYRHLNIVVVLDLDKGIPKSSADGQQIECVLLTLFARARAAIVEGKSLCGTIRIRTALNAGKIQCSITDDGADERSPVVLGPIFRRRRQDDINITICAEIVQDQGGELYAWRPHDSFATTIVMDLPTEGR
jgi:nitrogen fixation/metabolism regulation signal transduction histidine kinase